MTVPRVDWEYEHYLAGSVSAWDYVRHGGGRVSGRLTQLPPALPEPRGARHRLNSETNAAVLLSVTIIRRDVYAADVVDQWQLPNGDVVTALRRRLVHCLEGTGW